MTRKRRNEVVDAAARVFAERGFHGASTRNIAEFLGMRQASIYYYFGSKEEALEEVCTIGTAGFVDRAEAIIDIDIKPAKKLCMILEAHTLPLADRADYTLTFLNERKFLPTETACPPIPKPLNNESTIPLAVLIYFFSFFIFWILISSKGGSGFFFVDRAKRMYSEIVIFIDRNNGMYNITSFL